MSETVTHDMSCEHEKAVGHFVVCWRKGVGRYVVKVLSVDVEQGQMQYQVMSGPHKGVVMCARYLKGKPFRVYNEDQAVKALLST